MNWNQLQYVLTVAEVGTITHAAQRLYLSQPSLSLSIKALEEELGVALFQRRGGALTLTYAGTLFCQWARDTLQSHRVLLRKLGEIANEQRSLIRLGVSPHRSLIFMSAILEQFCARYPECELKLIEKPTFELKKLLEEDKIDFMIDLPHSDTVNYVNRVLAVEKIILALPQTIAEGLPAAVREKKTLALEHLADAPFILLHKDHVLGQVCRRMCSAAGFHPNLRLTCSTAESALAFARQQLAVTFVPEIFGAQQRYVPEVRYYEVENFQNERQVCLVYRKDLSRTPPMDYMLELFEQVLPALYAHPDGQSQ